LPAKITIISDVNQLEYDIGFPVSKENLLVFQNGHKLIDSIGYTFQQRSGTVLLTEATLGDEIMFRLARSK
jgi:hypothetical protein